MNEKKVLPVITDKDVENNGVQKLADRPNRSNQYGKSGLSAQGLKEWFDNLAKMLATNTREVSAAISGENATGEYIAISANTGYDNLSALVAAMLNGSFASNVLNLYPDTASLDLMSLQNVINAIAESITKNSEALRDLNGEATDENSVKWLIAAAVADLIGGEQGDDTSAYDTLKKLYELIGDKNKLPGALTEKTVIAYIESVAWDLAKKSAIKVNGEVQTEWDASGVVKEAALTETLKSYVLQTALTETLKSYVLQTALTETLKSYTKQNDFVALKKTVDDFFSDDAAINDTVDTLKEIANYISNDTSGAANITARVGALEGKVDVDKVSTAISDAVSFKLDAKFEAIDENKIRFLVAYPDGSIKAEKISTGGSY